MVRSPPKERTVEAATDVPFNKTPKLFILAAPIPPPVPLMLTVPLLPMVSTDDAPICTPMFELDSLAAAPPPPVPVMATDPEPTTLALSETSTPKVPEAKVPTVLAEPLPTMVMLAPLKLA